MGEVLPPGASWLAYMTRRGVLPSTPARARVAWVLLADPRRSLREVAGSAGASHELVRQVRLGLEGMGIIPVYRAHRCRYCRPPREAS